MTRALCLAATLLLIPLQAAPAPTLNELLVQLDNQRVTAEEALQATVRSCTGNGPKLLGAQCRYRDAREASNGLINLIILDLGQDHLAQEQDYRPRLDGARKSADGLIAYLDGTDCQGQTLAQPRTRFLPMAPATLAAKLPGLFDGTSDPLLQYQAAKERRMALTRSLAAMRWRTFNEVLNATQPDAAQAPRPILRLETGVHTSLIRSLCVSGDQRLALTASEDKTARIWDLATGRLLRTIRPFAEEGKAGMLYAAALSADGTLAALGGWTLAGRDRSQRILLVDTRTGAFVRILETDLEGVVNHLAFSPDGKRLVAHMGGKLGLRVFRVADGALMGQDLDFDGVSYRGAFDASGRYAATGEDGFVRLYDPEFKRLVKARASGAGPFGLAFSPNGSLLALAYADSPKVEVLRASDLTLAYTPAPGTLPLGLVAWSPEGQTLYGSGGADFAAEANVLRRWTRAGQGKASQAAISRSTVSDLFPLRDGGIAFAAQDPLWGVLGPDGTPRYLQAIHQTDLRAARARFRADERCQRVMLPGRIPGAQDLAFSWPARGLAPALPEQPLRQEVPGVTVADWQDGARPVLNGRALELEPFEVVRSLAASPSGILLGTDWYLRAFDATGQERWKTTVLAGVWGVVQSADGHLAVAMLGDGSFAWFRTEDGKALFSLFVAPDRRWAAWTPAGFFAVSAGGESLAGWQVNHLDQGSDFFPLNHFRDRFYRPELFPALLETLDEETALRKLQGGETAVADGAGRLPGAPVAMVP